jgi:predicted transcriptional regulator
MSIKGELSTLTKRALGPLPSFNVLDLIRLLRLLDKYESIGRGKISEALNLGEGTTRTMLRRLAKAGLITISKRGCSLTQKGKKLWSSIERIIPRIVEIGNNELTLAPKSVAVLVRGHADRIKSGIEQRDAAISFGAKGAVTLICRNNKLIIPSVSVDLERDYPLAFRDIMRFINPSEGDVIIISSADSLKEAEYGALAAAWSII